MNHLDKTAKTLLQRLLGLVPGDNGGKKADFGGFCGVWTEADEAEFRENSEDLRRVNPRDS
ncbi:MAG: hypothetical protein NTZ17_02430 [Phycisphaerae bacterium]|nr:hypothetical protein [Phycisphaerae bacterium]